MTQLLSDKHRYYNYLFAEIQGVYHEYAAQMGISDSICAILYNICTQGDCCPIAKICLDTGLSRQTVHSALQKLEREAKVELQALDGKAKQVRLTQRGRAYAAEKVHPLMELEDSVFRSWPEEELDQYIRLTEQFLGGMKEKVRGFSNG